MTDNPFIGEQPFSGEAPVTKSPELLKSGGKLRRAASIAKFNGVTMAVFAVVSGLWAAGNAAFGAMDWVSTIMAVGLGALAFNELKGRRMLLNCDGRAPARLGWNQVGLMVLIASYCGWIILKAYQGSGATSQALADAGALSQMQGTYDLDGLVQDLTVLIYGVVIVATVICQGGNAWYYFTRGKWLSAYISETPSDAMHHPESGG